MAQVCLCDQTVGGPLASFCVDDLYCPQCGDRVAKLHSPSFQPDPDDPESDEPTLWVYPSRSRDRLGRLEFRFTLELVSHGALRLPSPRPLELDPERCRVQIANFFAAGLDIQEDQGKVECVLRPSQSLIDNLYKVLPPEGARGTLTLAGDCGDRTLGLRVFNPPAFRVEVEGDGVQADSSDPPAWSLGRGGVQELLVRIWPENARIHLPEPPQGSTRVTVTPEFPDSAFRVESARHENVVGPDEPHAVEVRLTFDVDGWEHNDQKTVTVQLIPKVPPRLEPISVKFFRQAVGDLRFDPPTNLLRLPTLYYGERIESTSTNSNEMIPSVRVSNGGDDHLPLRQPVILSRTHPDLEWLEVRIEGAETGDELTLELEEERTLSVVVDLTGLSTLNHTEGEALRAELVFQHVEYGARTWTLQVLVPEVRTRPILTRPLAIDFGNTNTYAATVIPQRGRGIEGVLGHPDPETFPTALRFTDLSDRASPAFSIGVDALQDVESGEDYLVTGLKRELARRRAPGESRQRVFTWENTTVAYAPIELIQMYLERILIECETRLRHSVTHVGLSYPANFGPRARGKLEKVIQGLRQRWERRYPGEEVRFHDLNSDEASAVALGFALDRKQFDDKIKPKLDRGVNPFLVASFDFGGGSIDCALIRFEFTGLKDGVLTYQSRPLGIGGDEYFGGDNVTAAVYEQVRDRLETILRPFDVRVPLAELRRIWHRNDSLLKATNTERLLEAAEAVKRHACLDRPTDDQRRAIDAVLEATINRLRGQRGSTAGNRSRPLSADEDVAEKLRSAIREGKLLASAAEIEEHTIKSDFVGDAGYTIRDRIQACVRTLQDFVDRAVETGAVPAETASTGPHFIVLAGAGCRFPLAAKLLREAFPGSESIVDDKHPKSKVAFGLFRYLDQRSRFPDRVQGLAMACDYTHADLVWEESFDHVRTWIPSCTALKDPAWFPLRQVGLRECWGSASRRRIEVRRRTRPEPELLGYFDLTTVGRPIEPGVEPVLPPEPPPSLGEHDEPQVWMRLNGREDDLLLRVKLNGKTYGDWPLVAEPEPND